MATQPRRRQRDEFVDHYGLIMPWKYDFEDLEEYDHKPDEEDWFGIPDPHQAICKYLKQVRSSFGFDVDCRAPSWFDPVFIPIDLADAKLKKKRIYDTVIRASNIAITEINKETGLSYEFVEVEKAVLTVSFLHLLTIIVTLADVTTTIQAIVGEEVHYTFILEQWRIKPTPTSPPSTPAAAVTSPADAAMASTSPADAATASLASTPAAASSADAAAASSADAAAASSADAAAASLASTSSADAAAASLASTPAAASADAATSSSADAATQLTRPIYILC